MFSKVQNLVASVKTNPTFPVVVMEGFLARLGFGVITFALPYYALSLGMNLTEVGFLTALRLIVAILIKPIMGKATDRFGTRNVYAWSIAGRTLVGLLFSLTTTPMALFVVRALHGVATAARDPSAAFLITEHGHKNKMAGSFAWYATAKEVGASIGYLVAGVLLTLTHDNYNIVFVFSVITSFLSLVFVLLYVRESFPAKLPPKHILQDNHGEKLSPTLWWRYGFLALLIATTGNMVTYLFPVIATETHGLNKAQTSLILGGSVFIVIFAGPGFAWFSDNVSRKIVLSVRSIANCISSVLYLVPGFYGLALARFSDDAGKAAFRPAWGSLMAELSNSVPREKKGQTIAYLDTAQTAGEALGPALAGFIWDWRGLYWMLGFRFLLSIVTEVVALRTLKAPVASVLAQDKLLSIEASESEKSPLKRVS